MGKKENTTESVSGALEEYSSGLTTRAVILGLVFMIIMQYVTTGMKFFGNKPSTFGALAIPPIWIILVNELVGRIKKEWRFKPAEITLLLMPMAILAGDKLLLYGAPSGMEDLGANIWMSFLIGAYGLKATPYSAHWQGLVPDWMSPKGEALTIYYSGLKPGQTFMWDAFILPSIYWGVTVLLWSVLNTLLVFILVGPQWWEKERLPFIYTLGNSYIIAESGDIDEATNKSRLFSWKHEKVFWAGAVFGLLLSGIPVIYEVFPEFPPLGAYQWGIWSFYLPQGLLPPGVQGGGWVLTNMLYLGVLLPNDQLWTCLFAFLFFGVIYQYVGIQTGFLAYDPGHELDVGAWWGWRPPWPYAYMAGSGMLLGIAVWCLWLARDRIRTLVQTITKGKDQVEYGVSLKKGMIGIIVVSIAFIAWFAGFGMPVLIAILYWAIYSLYQIGAGRVIDETQTGGSQDPMLYNIGYTWLNPIGAAAGLWTLSTPTSSTAMFITQANMAAMNVGAARHSSTQLGFMGMYYAMVQRTKTAVKQALIWTIAVIVILCLAQPFLTVYIVSHGGGAVQKGSAGIANSIAGKGVESYAQIGPGLDFAQYGLWTVVGFFATIAMYLLRMRFSWFLIHPAMLSATMFFLTWQWLPNAISLVIKLIGVRVIGARKFDELARPFCCGAIVFYGFFYLVSMISNLALVTIPAWTTKWVP